ncbi:MAG TPA: hypothetical protein VNT57_05405 [Desulfobacteria bacterium]|nr:hypothetical protein [Desulfobacteria bacterium]
MDKAKSTMNKHKKKLLGLKNVVGVGVGFKDSVAASTGEKPKPGIVVLVKQKLPESQLEARNIIPKDVDGVITDVIEVGDLRLLGRTERDVPAQPGVSIGHYKITAGTFGALVKDKKTGEPLILSNNHVLANGSSGRDNKAKLGDPILLPGPHDGGTLEDNVIGRLYRFQPVQKVYTQSACPKAAAFQLWANVMVSLFAPAYRVNVQRQSQTGNTIDAALAKPVSPDRISPKILELGEVNGVAEAEVGMDVVKSGRTTGVTTGTIKALHATVQVDMGDGEEAVFTDQIIATPMSQGGDSGALVLDEQHRAIGLLFAGSDKTTVFNRIQNVMDILDITF